MLKTVPVHIIIIIMNVFGREAAKYFYAQRPLKKLCGIKTYKFCLQ